MTVQRRYWAGLLGLVGDFSNEALKMVYPRMVNDLLEIKQIRLKDMLNFERRSLRKKREYSRWRKNGGRCRGCPRECWAGAEDWWQIR